MATKKSAAKKAGKGTTGAASATINRKSITIGVGKRASFTELTRVMQKRFLEAGCGKCFSGLERFILDSRINPGG